MDNHFGSPHVFVTLTPRYKNWEPPLDKFPIEGEYVAIDSRIRRDPDLASRFFIDRFKLFIDKVVKPKFNVTEYWGRFEFQKNGLLYWRGVM